VTNLDYPPFYLLGMLITFPATTKRNIPWVEFMFLTLRSGQLYDPWTLIPRHCAKDIEEAYQEMCSLMGEWKEERVIMLVS
jgi:hypothetical protein